jgi:general secretion pathway protein A
MYNEYFGFKEAPFAIAPDPRYLYMTSQHREALAHLVYGLNSEGGCILLTGEVGTGKTTICRCLLEQIPSQAKVALVLNPKVNEIELLETICDELNISYPTDTDNSLKTYTDRIYNYLIESNRRNEKTVLIIDEAQNLDSKVLEQLRLLTNLETNQRKLLQIIILGQPELLDILARTEMRQLAQRITARFHLKPLTKPEMKAYISHRLAVAGQNIQLFPESSIKLLFKMSKGIPRLINILCDRALLGTYVENQYVASPQIVKKAAKEVFGELKNVEQSQKIKRWLFPVAIFASISIIAIVAFTLFTPPYNAYDRFEQEAATSEKTIHHSSDETLEKTQTTDTAQSDQSKERQTSVIPSLDDAANRLDNTIAPEEATQQPDLTPATKESHQTSIDEILNDTSTNPASAYQVLFETWGMEYEAETRATACKQAETYALNCLYKTGNLNSLKTHNRPAVLTLVNSEGKTRHITITSIDDGSATVFSSNTKHTIKLTELDKHWFGQFILLWNKPEQYTSVIRPGDRGNIIDWLNTQLEKINNTHSTGIINIYDQSLVEKVKTFQSNQGLTADGIVGPVTIIHINTQSGLKVPTLMPTPTITANNKS